MGEESDLFESYFNDKIFYTKGVFESGFNHVKKEEYEPRLLHLKGKRKIKCWEVEKSVESLNSGDIFILDMGERIL
jgi:hypothetical protein